MYRHKRDAEKETALGAVDAEISVHFSASHFSFHNQPQDDRKKFKLVLKLWVAITFRLPCRHSIGKYQYRSHDTVSLGNAEMKENRN